MPSFLKLSSSKHKNPYRNPHHPGHNPLPPIPISKPSTSTQPASPYASGNLLAEARLQAGRDPVSGKLLHQQPDTQAASESDAQRGARSGGDVVGSSSRGVGNGNGGESGAEQSAYVHRSSQAPPTMGMRYDLYAMECQRVREEQDRLRTARGGTEYYAPERKLSEFYSEPVRY